MKRHGVNGTDAARIDACMRGQMHKDGKKLPAMSPEEASKFVSDGADVTVEACLAYAKKNEAAILGKTPAPEKPSKK